MQLGIRPTVSSIVFAAITGALALALIAGCGPFAPAPVVGSFAGRLPASEAFIAIVTDGTEVRAYICDGVSGQELHTSEWFKGQMSGSAFELTSLSGNARLSVQLTADRARGSLTLPGDKTTTFQIGAVSEPAGFYLFKQTTDGVEYRAGWIILPDQQQRGSLVVGGTPRVAHSTLNATTLSASLPQLGTVRPAALTSANTAKGFGGGCFGCLGCC